MANQIVLLISIISFCSTAQAFMLYCKNEYGREIIPLQQVKDESTHYYQFLTPDHPNEWGEGVHCNWQTEPHSPQYKAKCTIEIDRELTEPCDHECADRVEVHYVGERGAPAKDVFCSSTAFSLNDVEMLDIFISPETEGWVKCDIEKVVKRRHARDIKINKV